MLLVARVRRTLSERGLVSRGAAIVVGTSGGPDSTALLDVLVRLSDELALRIFALGIDHGLREGAPAELALAAAHAQRLCVPFEQTRLSGAPDESIHAWARRERYAALREMAARVGASLVAVGHTQDDQAETVIARVLRGSGLRGLAGIAPARQDGVVRPLIDASRADVLAYLTQERLAFAQDPSNTDPRFERSRVRHSILPALALEDPRAALHLASLADEARAVGDALDALALVLLADATDTEGISLAALRRSPEVVALRALRHALGPEIGRAHLSVLASWLHGAPGASELRLPRSRTAQIVEDRVVVTQALGRDPDEEA